MFPTVIELGPLRLPTYTTLLSMGLVGSALLSLWQARQRGDAPEYAFDGVLLGFAGGLAGARAAYVILHWDYFQDHVGEAVRVWSGGLAWQGGLVLGLLLVLLYAERRDASMGDLLDVLAPGMAWFILCVWLGSGAAADVYGRETFPLDGWLWTLSADLPDLYGLRAPRVNVALLGALWSGLVLAGLLLLSRRTLRPGTLFLVGIALTGAGGLVLVPLQANPVPGVFQVRVDWLFYLALSLGGLVGLILLRVSRPSWQRVQPDA
jgi:phosphatidylglycerol:prolipoprotein diacylglycerol transferase